MCQFTSCWILDTISLIHNIERKSNFILGVFLWENHFFVYCMYTKYNFFFGGIFFWYTFDAFLIVSPVPSDTSHCASDFHSRTWRYWTANWMMTLMHIYVEDNDGNFLSMKITMRMMVEITMRMRMEITWAGNHNEDDGGNHNEDDDGNHLTRMSVEVTIHCNGSFL